MQHKRYGFGLAALASSVLFVGACSDTATDSPPSTNTTSAAASASPSDASGDAAHNDADVMFTRGMIPHHQQAIEMSNMLLGKQGIDPEVSSLAEEIKNAQGPEIEQMQGWLREWGMSSAPGGSGMPGHDMPGHQMPGGGDMGDMGDMPGMSGGGHGMMSAAIFLCIAFLLYNAAGSRGPRMVLAATAAGLIVAIGLSRVYLGVHNPSDVLAGWLGGTGWTLVWFAFFARRDRLGDSVAGHGSA